MSSRCPSRPVRGRTSLAHGLIAALVACVASIADPAYGDARQLRVCADPDNLPYSSREESGYENRIARLLAQELNADLQYAWLPLQRGFVRKTLGAGLCDVVLGVPHEFGALLTTQPYYRSAYMFVSRAASGVPTSFDAPAMRELRIGIPLIGDEGAATPPAHALSYLGISRNVSGYPLYGDTPQAERLIHALASGDLDVAIVWGPQAVYYARKQDVALAMSEAVAPRGLEGVPFEFSISMGVRKDNPGLRNELDAIITRRHADIDAILASFGIPQVGRIDQPENAQ